MSESDQLDAKFMSLKAMIENADPFGERQRQFQQELWGEFLPDPHFRYFYELVSEYHRRADEYDLSVCTGRTPDGQGFPQTGVQRRWMTEHARSLRQMLLSQATRDLQLAAAECDRLWQSANNAWLEQHRDKHRG